MRGARVFVTGGTGFFGTWLVEALVRANRALGLGARATILTRDESAFLARNPHLAGASELSFLRGDAREFEGAPGDFTHAIHAAAAIGGAEVGTRRVLDFARRRGVRRFLLASSGAVYGRGDASPAVEEDLEAGAAPPVADPYAAGKREAEGLALAVARDGLPVSIARGFAFVGPHLPLNGRFAIGNFIRDALRGGPILVEGDGAPRRSYLYASDLAAWLWAILLDGAPGRAYNVGSERGVTIAELARLVAAEVRPGAEVRIARRPSPGLAPESYLPSTRRARTELGLRETVGLEEAIRRTAAWARRAAAPGAAR